MWTAAPFTEYDHDFAEYPLSDNNPRSQLLHRRIDVDYNGWWTCMIPRHVAEELGQPLPLFIKWDERPITGCAAEHGYPTATLRCGDLAHGRGATKTTPSTGRPTSTCATGWWWRPCIWDGDVRGLVRSHFKATLKHLSCLEYSTVAIQNKAIDDFLAGPEHIFSILEICSARGTSDAQAVPGRGGIAIVRRVAGAVAAELRDEAAGESAVHRLPADPWSAAPAQSG